MQQTSQDLVSVGGMPPTSRVFAFNQALALGQPIELDLSQYSNQNRLANVQGAFLDNSAGTAPFSFSCGGGQTITIPAGYQGFFPIYWNATYICKLSGSGVVNITLVNFPTPAAVWNANAAGAAQSVIDVNLAQAMQAGMVKSVSQFLGSDGTYSGKRLADSVAGGLVAGAPSPIFGANSAGHYLRSIRFYALPNISGNTANAAISLMSNGTEILNFPVPPIAASAVVAPTLIYEVNDLDFVGAAQLTVAYTTAPSVGDISYYATGGNVTT
mgnify:CR=1 FL=1